MDIERNPVAIGRCPPFSEIRFFNKDFHNHPDYFNNSNASRIFDKNLDMNISSKILSQSHIGRTRHMDKIDSNNPTSRRIFRQSYEFIEPVYNNPVKPFRVGLNFVSFQNDPGRLFFILTDPNWMGNTNFGGDGSPQSMDKLLSVLTAGVFFVPSVENPFPGVCIFG